MRTIKFQFWEIAYKRMLLWEEVLAEETCGVSVFFDQPERYIPREFTGLKDTRDKEIYEGDILRVGRAREPFVPVVSSDETLVVVFKDGAFQTRECHLSDITNWHECEIIGNVWENPELLEGVE